MNQNADLIMNTNQWPILLDHFTTDIANKLEIGRSTVYKIINEEIGTKTK